VRWQDQLSREFDLAWAAGMLESRGLWEIVPRALKKDGYQPRISMRVHSSEDPVAKALTELFGGTTFANHGRRRWQVSGAKGCVVVSAAVLPYAKLYPHKIKQHLTFCRRITEYKRASFEERSIPAAEKQVREQLARAFWQPPIP
jgi:hypothetical protein